MRLYLLGMSQAIALNSYQHKLNKNKSNKHLFVNNGNAKASNLATNFTLLLTEQYSVIKSLKPQSYRVDKFYYLVGNMKH